jgi:hypothetical protein
MLKDFFSSSKFVGFLYILVSFWYLFNVYLFKNYYYDGDIYFILLFPVLLFPLFYISYGIYLFFKKTNNVDIEKESVNYSLITENQNKKITSHKMLLSSLIVIPGIAFFTFFLFFNSTGGIGDFAIIFLGIFIALGYLILSVIIYLFKGNNEKLDPSSVKHTNNFYIKSMNIFYFFIIFIFVITYISYNEYKYLTKQDDRLLKDSLKHSDLMIFLENRKLGENISIINENYAIELEISDYVTQHSVLFKNCNSNNIKFFSFRTDLDTRTAFSSFLIYIDDKLIYIENGFNVTLSDSIFEYINGARFYACDDLIDLNGYSGKRLFDRNRYEFYILESII